MFGYQSKTLQILMLVGVVGAYSTWAHIWYILSILPAAIIGIVVEKFGYSKKTRLITVMVWIVLVGGTVLVITKGWVFAAIIKVPVVVCVSIWEWWAWRTDTKRQVSDITD